MAANRFRQQKVETSWTRFNVCSAANLRRDPWERAQVTSNTYYDWLIDRAFLLVPAQTYVANFLSTFKKFPPRQKAASFSLDKVLETLQEGSGS